ncbi:ribosome biogenesis GTPase Der [Mycoplasma suis]|uniref:GTPase Der n=2 Tax=Mycoplasma suis TaxID=57372 RepID=F0QRA6_MYCSL|nr:ribosome biogenesis GTPase Der [Mycoplasma suis]ADX98026.1 GTP-binding protein engA [Mycoplasma suis str. Illinois]CBZ40523.1 GTP-binding protein EngA [Mycoplasma suis KI3806]
MSTRRDKKLPKVLIVGATNVGKSQLFNRLIGDRHSIVLNRKSITRDLVMRKTKLKDQHEVILIDSGGYSEELSPNFQSEINQLLINQLKESTIILFMFSKVDGIRAVEWKLSKLIHRYANCPVILAANKIDSNKEEGRWKEHANSLGFGSPILISAEHDINIYELIDKICNFILGDEKQQRELEEELIEEDTEVKLGIVGKVNVGKSSLANALLSSNAIIVSPIEGTTVDLVEYSISHNGKTYLLIDSPGWKKMKKEGLRNEELDHLCWVRSKKAIKAANILLFVIDPSQPINHLDEKVAKEIFESNLPVVIVANKWDLMSYHPDCQQKQKEFEAQVRKKFYFLPWAPIIFISAMYSKKLENVFKALSIVQAEISRLFPAGQLSSFLGRANLLLLGAKKTITLENISQVKSSIPTFIIQCSNPDNITTQQMRLVETQFRNYFNLRYSPLKIYYKKR